ncbi:uncharacterized protein JCM6883_005322 [Sporobolomyces salmoneus]|uniref:uncharacterized protein n=1 Tax=Sporobolomyces salmoneus TaxID=183962 RepID=UPI00317B8FF8
MNGYQQLRTDVEGSPTSESLEFNEPPKRRLSSSTTITIPSKIVQVVIWSIALIVLVSIVSVSTLKSRILSPSTGSLPLSLSADWSTTPSSLIRPRHNATIVILVSPSSNMYHNLLSTLSNVEEKFNRRLGYPIQLLTNGELPSEAIRKRTEWVTGGKAKWSLVTKEQGWGPPDWIAPEQIQKSIETVGFSEGYRNMCQFFSMYHWGHPAVREFEWVWRLDDTSRFHCALMDDPIELMMKASAIYGYSQVVQEALYVIPTLWNTTLAFLKDSKAEEKGWFKPKEKEANWLDFISNDEGKSYNLSFEIVHRSFFESAPYRAYTSYLNESGGFYLERWGDAPVRTIATSLFLARRKFYDFSKITGYQHEYPEFECPDLEWCDCDPEKSGRNGGGNW